MLYSVVWLYCKLKSYVYSNNYQTVTNIRFIEFNPTLMVKCNSWFVKWPILTMTFAITLDNEILFYMMSANHSANAYKYISLTTLSILYICSIRSLLCVTVIYAPNAIGLLLQQTIKSIAISQWNDILDISWYGQMMCYITNTIAYCMWSLILLIISIDYSFENNQLHN